MASSSSCFQFGPQNAAGSSDRDRSTPCITGVPSGPIAGPCRRRFRFATIAGLPVLTVGAATRRINMAWLELRRYRPVGDGAIVRQQEGFAENDGELAVALEGQGDVAREGARPRHDA